MSRPGLLLSIAIVAILLGAGGASSRPLQSPGSIRGLPDGQGTITTPSSGASHPSGHARAYRLCLWRARHPSPGIPATGSCIAPAGGDPGTPCTCRTEFGKFGGVVG